MKTYTESRQVYSALVSQGWKTTGILRNKNRIGFYLTPPKGMPYKDSVAFLREAIKVEQEEKKWQV